MGFLGLPRPPEALLMGFRTLAASLLSCKKNFSRSWLQVLFILTLFQTSRRTSKGLILHKLFLLPQVLISDFSTGLK